MYWYYHTHCSIEKNVFQMRKHTKLIQQCHLYSCHYRLFLFVFEPSREYDCKFHRRNKNARFQLDMCYPTSFEAYSSRCRPPPAHPPGAFTGRQRPFPLAVFSHPPNISTSRFSIFPPRSSPSTPLPLSLSLFYRGTTVEH